jgi:hypothetical protein
MKDKFQRMSRKVVFPYLMVLSLHLSQGAKGNSEDIRQDSHSPGRDSK